jgi:hypothetical protein
MDLKPGWKTTEFWTSMATAITGLMTMVGVFTPSQANDVVTGVTQAAGGLVAVVPVVFYALSRGKVKANFDAQNLAQTIAAFQNMLQSMGVEVVDEDDEEVPE